jgi:cell division ATPase FtsA
VRLTRSEFEEMIEDGVERTIDVFTEALETAGVEGSDLEAILLTGGSSRIPRIAELLSERFDRPIAIDADPKAIVALGAARAMADPRGAAGAALAIMTPAGTLADVDATAGDSAAVATLDGLGAATATAKRRWFERLPATAAMASGALVLASGIVLASATGLGSGPVSNAEGSSESLADWLGVTLFQSPAASAAGPEAAAPVTAPQDPPESIQRADYESPRSTPRPSNPRTESIQRATQAAAAPQAPTTASGGGTGSGSPSTATTPVDDATTPTTADPTPEETTPPPAPEETTPPPAPEETTPPPAPEETTPPPAPEETTPPPAPEETTPPPAPEETTPPPAPEETTPPPAPEPEPPAPEPSPSPTDPV